MAVSNLEDHVGYWLRFVSNHVSHAFRTRVEKQGVTVAEWVVLRELFEQGPVAPSRLADGLGMTRGAISKLVDRLCGKKLATRTTSDIDRRGQSISLTPAGRTLVPKLARLADANDRAFFGHLRADQRAVLVETLQTLVRRHGWKNQPLD